MKLNFYSDPAHGWLKVTAGMIRDLNIVDKISTYSYVKNGCVYLEEDCDAFLFCEAFIKKYGYNPEIEYSTTNRSSKIRSYNRYQPDYIKLWENTVKNSIDQLIG